MVSRLGSEFAELKRRVEGLLVLMDSASGGSGKNLELLVKDHHKVLRNQRTIMQALSKDVNISKKLVDDFLSSQASISFSAHDAVSVVGRMHDVHEKDHLPNMRDLDRKLSKLLDTCKGKKNDMNLLMHTTMKKVKSAQFGIKGMMSELHAFQELMENQDTEFHTLEKINGMGHAYRACLAEVVRRKSFLKLYMGLAGQMVERIAGERENEIRKRERFLKRWCKFIPREIFQSMGLLDSPSQCAVSLNPFDECLLPIDIADVDRFAPQSLVGPSSKSTDSTFDLIKSEESSLPAGEKAGFRDILEGCDALDITGTSRMEVENVRLRAELASAIAIICGFRAEIGSESVDADQIGSKPLEGIKEATDEALRLKDEYADHLQSLLVKQQEQCLSYEKRIHELEQRLYSQVRKPSTNNSASDSTFSAYKANDCSLDGDMVYSTPDSMNPKYDTEQNKRGEGGDENMANLSSVLSMQSSDLSILEHPEYENQGGGISKEATKNDSSDVPTDPFDFVTFGVNDQVALDSKPTDSLASDLQIALEEKSNWLEETENKLRASTEEVIYLRRELENSRNLLDESQTNCANMENCLHEAREEARTIKCAAERRAAEYEDLRLSALKVCTVFERLCGCVNDPGVTEFADSLQSLALSSSSSITKEEGDGDAELHQCIKVLEEKVGSLSQKNTELLDRSSRMEAAHGCQVRDLQEKEELIRFLNSEYQKEKKARKEMISFGHFAAHDLAAFVWNSTGTCEAINRDCSKYSLSEESIALLAGKQSSRPLYIIGKVVHIERRIAGPLM
ncbi:autophagy-related protein 11-like [Ananas comosus]|uniref:Autophagy-related protein 11-like n=1 Tax=Ananas comosus TaxID=4615 RepID=A0A6P5GKB1_ANACO|nr:autophagy-related protein 11-like [Ananas comosus]